MAFSLFWDNVSITSILPSGGPINYMVNLSNFSNTWPILDPKGPLDKARHELKLCLRG